MVNRENAMIGNCMLKAIVPPCRRHRGVVQLQETKDGTLMFEKGGE